MSLGTTRKPAIVTVHKVGRRAPSVKSGRSRHYVRTSDTLPSLKTRVVDSGISSTVGPDVKPQKTKPSAASRVKKVAKGFGLLVKPRFISSKQKKFPWIVKEPVTPNRISLPVLQSPLPSPTSLDGFTVTPSPRSSTSKETSSDELTPSQRIANRHSFPPIATSSLTPAETIPTKAFRHKRKPVPALHTDRRKDSDPLAYTSFIDFSIVEIPEPVEAPPADPTPSTTTPNASSEPTTIEAPLADPNDSTISDVVAEVDGDESVYRDTQPCLEVIADDAAKQDESDSPDTQPCLEVTTDDSSKQVALAQPPEHSHQPQALWPVLAKPPDGSLDVLQMINIILSFITQLILTLIMVISDSLVNVRSGSSTRNRERFFVPFHVGDDGKKPYSKKIN